MSLKDIGKYDVSEEAQALKDKLASQGMLSVRNLTIVSDLLLRH
jgi:hypothetical protein